MMTRTTVLAVTDDVVLPVSSVLTVMKELAKEGIERYAPMIITEASTISQVPLHASSVDLVLAISRTSDFPSDKMYGEFSRVLKSGGSVFVCMNSEGETIELLQILQTRVTLAGFLEPQSLDLNSIKLPNFSLSVGIKATWKIGSSFALNKPAKTVMTLTSWCGFRVGPDEALVVEVPYRFQLGGTCWVYGLGRHENGLCRIAGLFGSQTLCFASIYHGVESTVQLLEGGGLPHLEFAKHFLVDHGVPLESAIPGQVPLRPLYALREMNVHHVYQYLNYQQFEQYLFALLIHSPVAAAVPSFPSLFGSPDYNGLHHATVAETNMGWNAFVSHLMLLTGRGFMGELEFLEFQDSMAGSGGTIKLLLGQRTIVRFVEMLGPYIKGEDEEEEDEEDDYSSDYSDMSE